MRPQNIIVLAVAGAVIWLVAALAIRFMLPLGLLKGTALNALMFALSIPVAATSIEAAHHMIKGRPGDQIRTAAIISLVGLLLDGVAITWFPALYAPERADVSFGAAWLLWTVGVTLAWSIFRDQAAIRESGRDI